MTIVEFKKVSTTDLKSAAKELTVMLGLEPAIDSSSKEALITGINEAFDLLEDGEEYELCDKTLKLYNAWESEQGDESVEVDEMDYTVKSENEIDPANEIDAVIETPKKSKKEKSTKFEKNETETDSEDASEITTLTDAEKTTLIKTITKATDLKRLIEMIKGYGKEVFPVATRGLFLQKDIDKLKAKAIADLKGESVVPEQKEKAEKSEKVKKAPKGKGVIATIVELIETSKIGISKEEILKVLVKEFPNRPAESMKKTINVQVPNRITKERFKVSVLEGGLFKKE